MQPGSTACVSSLINAVFILAQRAAMEAVQKDYWYFLVLATFLIFFKDTLQKGPAVKLEDGMVLACQCPWTGNLSMVSWTKPPDREPIAVYHPEYGVVLGPQYKGRIKFIRATPLDGSISVSNVTEQDISVYHCSIQTFPKGSWTKDVHVKNIVEIGSFKPKAEVTTLEGDDAVLTCTSMHNGTISHISIEKMSTEGSGLVASCKVEDGRLEGEGFVERAHVNCTDATTASLQLTDVVEGDEGLYQCHFNTDAGIQTTTILLTVHTAVKAATYKPDVVVSVLEGDSVMLEFTHMHTGAVDHISIEKMGEGGRDLIAACTVENGTLVGEEYTGRANVECGNLVLLHLTNVVQADEGLYWCHFSTDDAVHTATIVLTVHSTVQ
uniref:CD226 molecule n=2 Tax=Denticeps clupeoides TaxID=299321 RepID=A0AAY4AGJ2_9TELE